MPIRRELRSLYPAHWSDLSRRVRFERAGGIYQGCGRPHGCTVRCLPDGRWYDSTRQTWHDRRGRAADWPDLEQIALLRTTHVVLAAAHLDHDPTNNRLRNLRSLCQRCHLIHDRSHIWRSGGSPICFAALGDLFLGPYRVDGSAPMAGASRLNALYSGECVIGSNNPTGFGVVINATPLGMKYQDPFLFKLIDLNPMRLLVMS